MLVISEDCVLGSWYQLSSSYLEEVESFEVVGFSWFVYRGLMDKLGFVCSLRWIKCVA